MLLHRTIHDQILNSALKGQDVVIIYGPRQSGKTTLLDLLLPHLPGPQKIYTGDDARTGEQIVPRLDTLKKSLGDSKLLVIDEAQKVENIGLCLKLVHDHLHIPIVVTGSASFDLANRLNEPLTGRTRTFTLFPLSMLEYPSDPLDIDMQEKLKIMLIYGGYPRTTSFQEESKKSAYLEEVLNNYLYKDILELSFIKKPKKILDLLVLLSHQVGSQVSVRELSQSLELDRSSVERYLDILEKMFIIYNLRGFSRNLRKEISKTSKYYFLDLGIRNAAIRNFNPLRLRNDIGQLFENHCVIERIKFLSNQGIHPNFYFWRTWDQKEIDLIEERGGHLTAWEFKFSPSRTSLAFKEFSHTYLNSSLQAVTASQIQRLYNEDSAVRFGPATGSP